MPPSSSKRMAREPDDGDRLLASLPSLLQELAASSVVELEVSAGEARLYLRQRPEAPPAPGTERAPAESAATGEVVEDAGLVAVVTPLSGFFYAAPAPDDRPYVSEGEEVEAGQVVALVEAMKVFNEIRTEVAGVVAGVLAKAGQLVQVGETLITLRPHPIEGHDARDGE